jgi:hypothetical protein
MRSDPDLRAAWFTELVGVTPAAFIASLEKTDPVRAMRLAIEHPELELVGRAVEGRPVVARDFFAVALSEPWMAPQPDAPIRRAA